MATATSKKPAAKKPAAKRPAAKKSAKKASPAKTSKKAKSAGSEDEEELEWMEVKKPVKKAAKKFPKLDLKPLKVKSRTVGKGRKAKTIRPSKLGGTQLINHVTEVTGLARKDVRLVIESMVNTVKSAIMPGGVGGAVIPGLLAVVRKDVKARKIPAIKKGTVVEKRPAPGQKGEVVKMLHPGRPASVKPKTVKARAMLLSGTRRAVFGTA